MLTTVFFFGANAKCTAIKKSPLKSQTKQIEWILIRVSRT